MTQPQVFEQSAQRLLESPKALDGSGREPSMGEDALCFVCLRWTSDGPDCRQPWCPDGERGPRPHAVDEPLGCGVVESRLT